MIWSIIVLLSIVLIIGIGIYNIRSLIKKLKYNENNWIDLMFGILIWLGAIAGLVVIFIRNLP